MPTYTCWECIDLVRGCRGLRVDGVSIYNESKIGELWPCLRICAVDEPLFFGRVLMGWGALYCVFELMCLEGA